MKMYLWPFCVIILDINESLIMDLLLSNKAIYNKVEQKLNDRLS